jgi:hypothetical protein
MEWSVGMRDRRVIMRMRVKLAVLHTFVSISFLKNAGIWTDVFGIESSVNFLPSRLSNTDDFSWSAHNSLSNWYGH